MRDAVAVAHRADGSPARLLVVEDESVLVDLLTDALRFVGYQVESVTTAAGALREVAQRPPDLVILDVNLPDLDGFEVCRRLRADGNQVPVIFLTARQDRADLRAGFAEGGDDYLTKPFALEELALRVHAVLRRSPAMRRGGDRTVHSGPLRIDLDGPGVRVGDAEVALSPTEYSVLRYLAVHQGEVLTKQQLLRHVWQYEFGGDTSIVETYISYLRRKLGPDGASLIRTVRGFGYTLRED
ncbi:response regulator transcription factor [Amycolatopsis nigrescens]|uniref:response regulator transcription factor n=1 Tax=Amycolatopsis nigrescens TaxID=381445 RepID=UPI00037E8964|nr:response regulator transcription factor [Amycolatopsis nigrescens]